MPSLETALLENSDAQVTLLNLGGITQSWRLADWPQTRSAVLGYQNAADYKHNPHYLGAIIGRVANRISDGQFDLDGTTYRLDKNEPSKTLHGGTLGLSQRYWQMERDGTSKIQLRLTSKHGDQGFPADVEFTVVVSLEGDTLTYDMSAIVSEPTPIAMTQHNYYNLNGVGHVEGHTLQIPSETFLKTDAYGIPTNREAVENTPLDFRSCKPLSRKNHQHLDTNYCLAEGQKTNVVLSNAKDARLTLHTTQAGLQVYTAGKLNQVNTPFGMQTYEAFSGICLEPQAYPNAVNRADFPSVIVTPDMPYRHILKVTLEAEPL